MKFVESQIEYYYIITSVMDKPYVALFTAIVAVSFASIFILSCDAPPLTIALYRLLFTTLLILPFVLINKKIRDELLKIPRPTLAIMILIGLVLAAHFALWITSLTKTSVASSVILVTAHPIIVGPISYYFLKEKLSSINAIGITASVVGVIILVLGNYGFPSFALDTLEGNILAMLGGIAAGFYILGGRKIRKSVSILSYAFVVYSVGTVTLFMICLMFNAPVYNLSLKDYQIILLMALVSGIFGHTLYNWTLEHIRASVASVVLLGEPVGSSLLAYAIPWIHQEPSIYTITGGGIILLGIYLTSRNVEET
ncbi:MAG: EamA family transporter [Thermoplasmatales archaeon]|nr:EamA family transporter [Thermoplasmatales archaeon]